MDKTDHSEQIAALRERGKSGYYTEALAMRAAADLLEVHDATGISLDDWTGPRDLVNNMLNRLGYEPLTPNHV